jgi:hypothetical protein
MTPVYHRTAVESGPGQYMRMKHMMHEWVEDRHRNMFEHSVAEVRKLIDTEIRKIRGSLEEGVLRFTEMLKRDYRGVFRVGSEDSKKARDKTEVLMRGVRCALQGMVEGFEATRRGEEWQFPEMPEMSRVSAQQSGHADEEFSDEEENEDEGEQDEEDSEGYDSNEGPYGYGRFSKYDSEDPGEFDSEDEDNYY